MTNLLVDVDDWQHAVTTLIDHYGEKDLPFSSGEIAKEIREQRPEFNFSVAWVGNFVRDLFYSDSIVFSVAGREVGAFMVPRTTTGKSRTPSGVEVFVYASHPDRAENHDFEVEIPKPQYLKPDYNGPEPVFSKPKEETEEWVSDEKVQERSKHFTVRVHSDKRLCFTRPLLETFFHRSKRNVHVSDLLFIREEDDKVILTLESVDGASPYRMSESRGRVLYPMKLEPGKVFDVEITSDSIVVSL